LIAESAGVEAGTWLGMTNQMPAPKQIELDQGKFTQKQPRHCEEAKPTKQSTFRQATRTWIASTSGPAMTNNAFPSKLITF